MLDIKKAYNNLAVESLKTEEDFTNFYVQRPESSPSPIEELKERIECSERSEKYLFLGFRGCGKSTELNKLCQLLDKNRFLITSYSVREELNSSDFDFRDFFASMALKIYEVCEEEIELNKDIKKDFKDFMMRITEVSEEDVIRYSKIGIAFSKFLLLKLGREVRVREYIRKELETKISDLIQRIDWFIREMENKTGKKLVVIVDDLDKLTRQEQAEEFFYKNYGLLTQPKCFVIYIFPIPLAFHPYYENVRHAFDNDVILSQFPVKSKDGKIIKENFNFYKQVVEKRIDLNMIEEEALEEAILSTGKICELISVLKDAAIKAYHNEKEKITKEEILNVIKKLRWTYDRTLTEAHKKRLLEIYEKKEARDIDIMDSISRDLLFSLTAVEYEDEKERWCDVNPLLIPLVEKWKKA